MTERILLGRVKSDIDCYARGENLYLEKHKWDCDWYWAFGYIGNNRCHFHFDSLLYIKDDKNNVLYEASKLFSSTNISDKEWWVIRDLFVQAYALKSAAEVYRYGGHQTTNPGVTDIIKNADKAADLNKDLEKVLDVLWDFVVKATKEKE